jgi:putative holliday junction resolvase
MDDLKSVTRALGIDLGEARVGLAISDELGMLAHPLETISVKSVEPLARIAEIVVREKIGAMVLGLPRNMDGTYGPAAEKARAFGEKLRELTGCPVKMWDERLTTVAAQKSLHAAGRNVKQSRAVIDQAAAQLILQSWMDAQTFRI